MSKWHLIESAPKNEPVLVFDAAGIVCEPWGDRYAADADQFKLYIFPAHFDGKDWVTCLGTIEGYSYESDSDSWVAALLAKPSHWMPLPERPT